MPDHANRRDFLRASGALALTMGAVGAAQAAAPEKASTPIGRRDPDPEAKDQPPPKPAKVDPLVVGVMGTNGRGTELASEFATQPGSVVRYVCDVDANNAARCAKAVKERQEVDPRVVTDFRRILDDKSVDALVIAAPDHWHAIAAILACKAGKHVYVEKPITTTLAEADDVVAQADAAGLLLGSAPDTFLGSAAQTARVALDDGAIGEPIGVAAFITSNRVETWHPDPTFLFQPGGGPVADLGPYYLTAMVNLFGPLASVVARSRIGTPTLPVTSPDRRVDSVTVTVPTHVSAALQFSSGVVGTLLASFDVWDHHLPRIEVYGTEGTLGLPDPNGYDGDVLLKRRTDDGWRGLPPVIPPFAEPGTKDQFLRGPGVADLVAALGGAPQRAGAPLACHVLEAIEAIETSGRTGESVRLSTLAARPAPVQVAAGHER